MRSIIPSILFITIFLFGQEDPAVPSKIYWNSLATSLQIGVPLADDESLEGGWIQIRVSFNNGANFSDLGELDIIKRRDIDDVKNVVITEQAFESMPGFSEGGEAHFIAEIWDRAGNSKVGTVSDSILTIDETIPFIVALTIQSTNTNDMTLANPSDTVTFKLIVSEPILVPLITINGDKFEPAGTGNTWITQYPCDEADDGPLEFTIEYADFAENPGETRTVATNNSVIILDGTEPELDDIKLFSSNKFDSTQAIISDTVFLQFTATESILNSEIFLNRNQGILKEKDSLKFTFYHIFTEVDTEGVIPISINFNDFAGNEGETIDETSDDSEVIFDMTPPQAFKVGAIESTHKKRKGNKEVTITDSTGAVIMATDQLPIISGTILTILGATLATLFLLIWISWFKIFSKAGQAGWKALIPVLNLFVLTKLFNQPVWWFVIYLILPVGHVFASFQFAKLFDKKILFKLGLIFLPFVFHPILAFGKSTVVKKKTSKSKIPPKKKK